MGFVVDPDRSSIEVKALLRRLHPKAGNHKDRIRRISKFRNYINGDGKNTPEFYDDDVPLLLLGSVTPSALLQEDDEALSEIYGLMQACGSPSVEHENGLKRSARHSMMLLKYLVCDYVEMEAGQKINNTSIEEGGELPVPLNVFSHAFCSLAIRHYQMLRLELHIREGNNRGAAKEEACQILVLLLTQHYSEDGQSLAPLLLDDLVPQPTAQQAFELWAHTSTNREQQEKIKQNAIQRQNEIAMKERKDQLANKTLQSDVFDLDDDDQDEHSDHEDSDGSDSDLDENDALAVMRRRQKQMQKELKKARREGELAAMEGPAMRWEDSQLYREQQARAASSKRAAEAGQHHETVRESQEAMEDLAFREEEKAKILGRDPLGLLGDDFDLRKIQDAQAEYMEQTLQALEEGMHKAERENSIEDSKNNSAEDDFKRQQAQKESLMAIVDRLGGLDQLENPTRSVLPTDPTFDPMLFLTLVHREVGYRELIGSVDRLTNKTTNQHKQLQNLVRENFPLFVRCAEGIDAFNEKTGAQEGPGVNERIDKLETLAEKCAHQAKKSFKPLLDNASEVRKVQSSLAVLNRVAPILQAPFLMRQHVENRRYSQALKAYRRVLVIDKNCTIELLNHVKQQAQKYLHETRLDLERTLAQDKVSIEDLLNGIRDLSELLELDVPIVTVENNDDDEDSVKSDIYRCADGIYDISGRMIKMREYPPPLACLMLQAAHFTRIVDKVIRDADQTIRRVFEGETLQQIQAGGDAPDDNGGDKSSPTKVAAQLGNQWKYDIMDARVLCAVKSVEIARTWLPRLLRISKATREDEKRRSARFSSRRSSIAVHRGLMLGNTQNQQMSAFDVFRIYITPSVTRLVEHATFCSLGCPARSGGSELNMSFGDDSPEKLRTLLRGALPPSHGTRVGTELAEMVELLSESSSGATGLRPTTDGAVQGLSPLDECKTLGESAVITLEKRRCIIAFEVCARACSNRASGSGKFDAESLLQTLRTLSEQLTRPEECTAEVENGCELVVQRCCEGLASYVRDRSGDSARLSAVAECADVMENRVTEIIKEVENLTSNAAAVDEVIMEDIMGLEGAMFDEYLESIREAIATSVRVGWLDMDNEGISANHDRGSASFPSYLSSSLLSIVRCRAQVEQALGGKIRRSDDVTYQHLSMATVADGVVEGICHAVEMRRNRLKVRQADRLANELQFLLNTLRKFLSEGSLSVLDSTRLMLCNKAGRGSGFQGDGPDGLAALESLERLGRVYVLCLGE